MGKFRIVGGAPLFGTVKVSGSKNGALPVIFATLATYGISKIINLPDIGDVRVALSLVEAYGAKVWREGDCTFIDTRELKWASPPESLITPLRASTYLLGATAVRFERAEIRCFGGCNFSPRPIDLHLMALESHGAEISGKDIRLPKLLPSTLDFPIRSVGATVNALILAAGCQGESIINGCASEPHIQTLIDYLRSAGCEIEFENDRARVRGGTLGGGEVRIPGDMIEAGSFLALSILTGGSLRVSGVNYRELNSFYEPLLLAGVRMAGEGSIELRGAPRSAIHVKTAPYPGFPTDLQPIIAPVMSISGGSIDETVWCGRFGYLRELARFNIASRLVGSRAEIFPSEIAPAIATAPDLRGGMALVIAALAADGESEIENAECVLRGYERLPQKLSLVGAEIKYCRD